MHLHWSPGTTSDDRLLSKEKTEEMFVGKQIVVTEKIDGECTSMYRDHIHARSMDSRSHPSQDLGRAIHARVCDDIPEGWRICGEYVYAKHSIFYDKLTAFFYVFSIWDEKNTCLSWDDTKEYADLLNLFVVPELYVGIWDEEKVKACWTGKSTFGEEQEGYVVRVAESFLYPETPFFETIAKFVRSGWSSGITEHWRTKWIPNHLDKKDQE